MHLDEAEVSKYNQISQFSKIWCGGFLRVLEFWRKTRQGKANPYQKIKTLTETARSPRGGSNSEEDTNKGMQGKHDDMNCFKNEYISHDERAYNTDRCRRMSVIKKTLRKPGELTYLQVLDIEYQSKRKTDHSRVQCAYTLKRWLKMSYTWAKNIVESHLINDAASNTDESLRQRWLKTSY